MSSKSVHLAYRSKVANVGAELRPVTIHPTRQSIAPRPLVSRNAFARLNGFEPKNPA